jgi:hypothetical protein
VEPSRGFMETTDERTSGCKRVVRTPGFRVGHQNQRGIRSLWRGKDIAGDELQNLTTLLVESERRRSSGGSVPPDVFQEPLHCGRPRTCGPSHRLADSNHAGRRPPSGEGDLFLSVIAHMLTSSSFRESCMLLGTESHAFRHLRVGNDVPGERNDACCMLPAIALRRTAMRDGGLIGGLSSRLEHTFQPLGHLRRRALVLVLEVNPGSSRGTFRDLVHPSDFPRNRPTPQA